jgi:hypothetical protein
MGINRISVTRVAGLAREKAANSRPPLNAKAVSHPAAILAEKLVGTVAIAAVPTNFSGRTTCRTEGLTDISG